MLFVHALSKRKQTPLDVTIVEQRELAGQGLAYSTPCESHLLNVPVDRMSIDGEEPGHFLRWLNVRKPVRQGGYTEDDFVSRGVYGEYLRDALAKVATCAGDLRLSIVRETAYDARRRNGKWYVTLSDGVKLAGNVLVLATGNEPPNSIISSAPAMTRSFIVDDPWDWEAKRAIAKHETVLIVGSGLTAVDTSIELLDAGHTGSIVCISRRALLPHTHTPAPDEERMTPPYPTGLRDILVRFRDIAGCTEKENGWQDALEAMRPVTSDLWRSLPLTEQRRFLRHLKTYWNAHRHRVAPAIGSQILRAVGRGRLMLVRGRIKALHLGRRIRICA